jgi:hypothetical protein
VFIEPDAAAILGDKLLDIVTGGARVEFTSPNRP